MSLLDVWLTPKVRVQAIIRIRKAEAGYLLQNQIKTWGVPGRIRPIPGGGFDVELEGREKALKEKLLLLGQSPVLIGGSMQVKWLPYTGQYKILSISF